MFDDMFASLSQDEKCNFPVGEVNRESWVLVQTANKLSNEFLILKIFHKFEFALLNKTDKSHLVKPGSQGSKWDQMGQNGSIWVHKGSNGLKKVQMGPDGSK